MPRPDKITVTSNTLKRLLTDIETYKDELNSLEAKIESGNRNDQDEIVQLKYLEKLREETLATISNCVLSAINAYKSLESSISELNEAQKKCDLTNVLNRAQKILAINTE